MTIWVSPFAVELSCMPSVRNTSINDNEMEERFTDLLRWLRLKLYSRWTNFQGSQFQGCPVDKKCSLLSEMDTSNGLANNEFGPRYLGSSKTKNCWPIVTSKISFPTKKNIYIAFVQERDRITLYIINNLIESISNRRCIQPCFRQWKPYLICKFIYVLGTT